MDLKNLTGKRYSKISELVDLEYPNLNFEEGLEKKEEFMKKFQDFSMIELEKEIEKFKVVEEDVVEDPDSESKDVVLSDKTLHMMQGNGVVSAQVILKEHHSKNDGIYDNDCLELNVDHFGTDSKFNLPLEYKTVSVLIDLLQEVKDHLSKRKSNYLFHSPYLYDTNTKEKIFSSHLDTWVFKPIYPEICEILYVLGGEKRYSLYSIDLISKLSSSYYGFLKSSYSLSELYKKYGLTLESEMIIPRVEVEDFFSSFRGKYSNTLLEFTKFYLAYLYKFKNPHKLDYLLESYCSGGEEYKEQEFFIKSLNQIGGLNLDPDNNRSEREFISDFKKVHRQYELSKLTIEELYDNYNFWLFENNPEKVNEEDFNKSNNKYEKSSYESLNFKDEFYNVKDFKNYVDFARFFFGVIDYVDAKYNDASITDFFQKIFDYKKEN